MQWIDKAKFLDNIDNGNITFSINRSHFPNRSHLVSAYIIAFIDTKIVIKASFITIVAIEYRHSCTAELCGILGIYMILKLSIPSLQYGNMHVKTSADY